MTNDTKINFTLRTDKKVIEQIGVKAAELGISKNAFIVMMLRKELAGK
ncbi:toxin-antitoxin system HicB family antitoxin [Bacillus benzoevorans]|uniref:Putative HicB family RNase H-like nuclease n=1 Tax=Bacillus benzoevorans TaxID=1456 RepID=A0A7X0HTE5_9BACI|nr:toxin-antitoxin system HicB family antitoxin [Bacillus benzoevorans]MBB6446498.1 putative HicB family RNase H-like nuclease [Bacillus benzoevorans]